MPSNNLGHAFLATRATAGSYWGSYEKDHAWTADTSSWLDTDGPIQSRSVQVRHENWKACEAAAAAAAAARDGNQKRVIHRWRDEGSCEAFLLQPVALLGVRGQLMRVPCGFCSRRGREPQRAGRGDDLLGESFPLKLFWTLCPLRTVAI